MLNPVSLRSSSFITFIQESSSEKDEEKIEREAIFNSSEKFELYQQVATLQGSILETQRMIKEFGQELYIDTLRNQQKLLGELLQNLQANKKLTYLLFEAITSGSELEVIEDLIQNGADLNLANDEGRLPLHESLRYFHSPIASFLLKSGAHPLLRDCNQETAFFHFEGFEVEPAINLCEEMFRSSDLSSKEILAMRNHEGKTPIHSIITNCKDKFIVYLVDKGADPNAQAQSGYTPLHEYVMCGGNESSAIALIHAGADLNMRDKLDRTPLSLAFYIQKIQSAKFLISMGASLDSAALNEAYHSSGIDEAFACNLLHLGEFSQANKNKLFFAIKFGLVDETEELLKSDWDSKTLNSLLKKTIINGNVLFSFLLLEKGADPSKEYYGSAIAKELVKIYKKGLSAQDRYQEITVFLQNVSKNPLHKAKCNALLSKLELMTSALPK